MQKRKSALLILTLVAAFIAVIVFPQPSNAQDDSDKHLVYNITASNARVVRNVMGEITGEVMGVPAEPVHSFAWDGEGVTSVKATAEFEIHPIDNTGMLTVEWTDEHGDWTLTQDMFALPPHPTGLQVPAPGAEGTLIQDDPVTTGVFLHGDTTAGEPVLPIIFNYVATWGPASVTLNGEAFENPFDGPVPMWATHTMLTAGVRAEDGTVRTASGEIYNPELQGEPAMIDYNDMEFHVVFHDLPGPEPTDSFPPVDFFYHLSFEDVTVEVTQSEGMGGDM